MTAKVQSSDLRAPAGKAGNLLPLPAPTPWPNANARLLGVGAGLPVRPLDRLAQFSPNDFERFTLEWATDYLARLVPGVFEVQQRGGAGDKGRDVIVWFDPPTVAKRRWHLYQCKRYADRLGSDAASAEIAKVLYYTWMDHYHAPEEYWFVTHKGVTGLLQDLLDDPAELQKFILANWDRYCAGSIQKGSVPLTDELRAHINQFNFGIFRAKQPHDLIAEHGQTRHHLVVFGAPLINRPPPPKPPSAVVAAETVYVSQLYKAIADELGLSVQCVADFAHRRDLSRLFERARLTFYSAEGLKELAVDYSSRASRVWQH